MSQTGTFKQQTLDHEIAWLKGTTPYRLFGEYVTWLLAAMGVVAAFVSKKTATRYLRIGPA